MVDKTHPTCPSGRHSNARTLQYKQVRTHSLGRCRNGTGLQAIRLSFGCHLNGKPHLDTPRIKGRVTDKRQVSWLTGRGRCSPSQHQAGWRQWLAKNIHSPFTVAGAATVSVPDGYASPCSLFIHETWNHCQPPKRHMHVMIVNPADKTSARFSAGYQSARRMQVSFLGNRWT